VVVVVSVGVEAGFEFPVVVEGVWEHALKVRMLKRPKRKNFVIVSVTLECKAGQI